MAGKNGAGNTRRILILIIAVCDAVSTAALALFHDSMERGLAVALGYAILFLTAFLMNLCIAGKATSIKEISVLVFSIVLLALVISAIAFILFNADDDTTPMFHAEEEERPFASHPGMGLSYNEDDTAEEEEDVINIPSPPTVFNTITINKEATDIPEPSEILITERDDEIMIPSVPEVFGMVRNVDREDEVSIPSEPEVFGLIRDAETEEEPVAIPSVPEMFGVIREVDKGSVAPIVPVIIPEEKVEDKPVETVKESDDFFAGMTPDEMEFWSSFYIEGEDEIELADGIYYMALYINERDVGDIMVQISEGKPYLSVTELSEYLDGTLTDEAEARILRNRDSFVSLDDLQNSGVQVAYDLIRNEVYLTFSISDMPVQVLSISGASRRSGSRPIAGASVLDPAVFMLSTRYTLSGGFSITPFHEFVDSLRFQFSTYNIARLYDVYANFSYSLEYYRGRLGFSLGNYEFYTDFQEPMIRLRWGNINTELLSPSGTSIGIRFDKSLSYGGPDAHKKSHLERILTVEKESDVQIINEGREIFRRTLQPGNYRLQDFILYSGANRIRIIVTPLDGSPATETELDISYASSLLAPGEIYFGAGLATGRSIVSNSNSKPSGAVRLPWINNTSFEYDARNLVLSGYIRAGLTESLTLDASLAIQNKVTNDNPYQPVSKIALEFTHANVLGTTRYNFNVTERSDKWGTFEIPELYARISHQVNTGWSPINSFNLSFTYDSNLLVNPDRHSLMLSLNSSGSISKFSWGLGTSVTLDTDEIAKPRYYVSGSLSYSFSRNFYMSASMSLDGYGAEIPSLSGRVSATLRFSPGRLTASVSDSRTAINVGVDKGRHTFSAEVDVPTLDILRPAEYTAEADYSYSGDYFNVNIGANADNLFGTSSMNFSVSTASVFADGLMGFSSSIPSNFILIKQKGALKVNDLTIGAIGVSASDTLPMALNTGLYTGISLNRASSLSVFSVNTGSFGSATSFDVTVPASQRSGYVMRITAENKYSVSGVVILPNGTPYINQSSPVYRVIRDDEEISVESSDYYVFTDADGRFTLSDLEPGEYGFDVLTDEGWLLYTFTVIDQVEHALDIYVYGESIADENVIPPQPYSAIYSFTPGNYMTGDEFWNLIYPPVFEEAV